MERSRPDSRAGREHGLFESPGLWGDRSDARPMMPRPLSASRLQLKPLDSPAQPLRIPLDSHFLPPPSPTDSPAGMGRSPGHLGMLRSMRRSVPSAIDHSWVQGEQEHHSVRASWPPDGVCATPPRLPGGGSRRNTSRRRIIDIGSFGHGSRGGAIGASSRGQSCAALLQGKETSGVESWANSSNVAASQEKKVPTRSASVPPSAVTANPEEKARAVAALQKLFFEEMKSGGDANGAAARALRRLSELQAPSSCLSPAPKQTAVASEASPVCTVRPRPPAIIEIDVETPSLPRAPAVPRRPSPVIGGRRRPSPMVRVRG